MINNTTQSMLQMYYIFVFMACGSFSGMILIGFISALYGKDSAVSKAVVVLLCVVFIVAMAVIITLTSFLEISYRRF